MTAAPGPIPAFRLSEVGYRYGEGVVALERVSLTIGMGETVAILGANGCGKSTLIKMLDGLIHPQTGEIEAFGEPLTEESLRDERFAYRFRRRVGFIFQNSDAQLFSATVRDEIAFGPLQMGLSVEETERRIRDVAALLDIARLLERPPFQLSGGEKKRVAIACSLAINPDVLLLDEPTNGLDPRSQVALVELLVRLGAAGKTLVTATHDLNIVPRIAARALVFSEEHTVVADASSQEILADLPLLRRVNLVHEYLHRHGEIIHAHPHPPDRPHDHTPPRSHADAPNEPSAP